MYHFVLDMLEDTNLYIEDIVILSDSLEKYLQHIKNVFQRLVDNKRFVKNSKYPFAQPEIEFVGCIVDSGGRLPQCDS